MLLCRRVVKRRALSHDEQKEAAISKKKQHDDETDTEQEEVHRILNLFDMTQRLESKDLYALSCLIERRLATVFGIVAD